MSCVEMLINVDHIVNSISNDKATKNENFHNTLCKLTVGKKQTQNVR